MADLRRQLAESVRDRYVLERELGHGGMATVYLARDLKHKRPVALKVLRPELAASLGPERFQREIEFAARLQHPYILTVLDSGDAAGHLWFTMPYVEGESLRTRVAREGQLSIEAALRIASEAAQALQYAHEHGVIHRDIKPENLLLTTDGNTLVADFGIARALGGEEHLTRTGMTVGTPAYMSPEQASGDKGVDARTDIYSLGAVLYEMLAGEPPFTGPTAQAIFLKRFAEPAPSVRRTRPTVPESVDQAIQQALAPVPADRFATAAQFAQALALPVVTPVATPTVVNRGPRAPSRSRPWIPVGLATLAAGFLLAIGVLFAWRSHHEEAVGDVSGRKMLVVLPFENLGPPEDEYFADGLTEAISTRLGSVPRLGIIARQSAIQYKRTAKSPKQIGEELGVQYILSGTVRWDRPGSGASRVRVSPQLIAIGDQRQVWAEQYDTTLASVFEVESILAKRVASALDLALAGSGRESLEAVPTRNLDAYDAYLRGKEASDRGFDPGDLAEALRMYERAVTLDSSFAAAFAELSITHSFMYWLYFDRSAARLARAKEAVDRARELAPDLAETHLALANYYYRSALDYDRALSELVALERIRPGDPDLARWRGYIRRRQGRWDESLIELQRAAQLNPRAAATFGDLGDSYLYLRRYREALAAYDRALALNPGSADIALHKTLAYLSQTGDLAGAQRIMPDFRQRISPVGGPTGVIGIADLVPLLSREQQDLLLQLSPEAFVGDSGGWALARAMVYRTRAQEAPARMAFEAARAVLARRLALRPDDDLLLAEHGFALAGLGEADAAVRQGMRATEMRSTAQDAVDGPLVATNLARIYAMLGRSDAAIDQLQGILSRPGPLSPAWLQADPTFAPLKGNPRFERLAAGK